MHSIDEVVHADIQYVYAMAILTLVRSIHIKWMHVMLFTRSLTSLTYITSLTQSHYLQAIS